MFVPFLCLQVVMRGAKATCIVCRNQPVGQLGVLDQLRFWRGQWDAIAQKSPGRKNPKSKKVNQTVTYEQAQLLWSLSDERGERKLLCATHVAKCFGISAPVVARLGTLGRERHHVPDMPERFKSRRRGGSNSLVREHEKCLRDGKRSRLDIFSNWLLDHVRVRHAALGCVVRRRC
mgnify:CR=1 FL=1